MRLEKISEEERGKCDVSMYISYAFRDGYAKGLAVHGFISVLLE
jgi:hypothetical protein